MNQDPSSLAPVAGCRKKVGMMPRTEFKSTVIQCPATCVVLCSLVASSSTSCPAAFTHLLPMQDFLFFFISLQFPRIGVQFSLPPFSTLLIFLLKLFFWNPNVTSIYPMLTIPRRYAYKCKLLKPGIFICFVLNCISCD